MGIDAEVMVRDAIVVEQSAAGRLIHQIAKDITAMIDRYARDGRFEMMNAELETPSADLVSTMKARERRLYMDRVRELLPATVQKFECKVGSPLIYTATGFARFQEWFCCHSEWTKASRRKSYLTITVNLEVPAELAVGTVAEVV